MPHKFDDRQLTDGQGSLRRATGPVEDNEKMFWIAAFVYQNGSGHYAAAAGRKRWRSGRAPKWICRTRMVPGSQSFNQGSADAWALALVTDGSGRKFHAWHDDVEIA